MPQVQKALCLIFFWVNPLFQFSVPAPSFLPLSGVIDNWTLQYECQKGGNFLEQNQLNRLLMVQFECPRVRNPFDSIICNLYTVIWKEEERERRGMRRRWGFFAHHIWVYSALIGERRF